MFDIAFSEMVVIAVVALIVVGPERLPRVARTIGNLIGRLQRYVSDVKADINREMELEELGKFRDQFQSTVQSLDHSVRNESSQIREVVETSVDSTASNEINQSASNGTADDGEKTSFAVSDVNPKSK